jgi:hypothetical protein
VLLYQLNREQNKSAVNNCAFLKYTIMKNIILTGLVSVLLIITSCSKIIYWFSGGHDPRLESIDNIYFKAVEFGIEEKPLIGLKESYILKFLKKRFNTDALFDRNGYELLYNKDFNKENCKGNILQLLTGLTKETFIERDSTNKINLEAEAWQFIDRDSSSFNLNEYLNGSGHDYLLVTYWNTFSGKQNNINRLKDLFIYVGNNKNVKIKHILVNQDFRDNMKSFEITK